MERDPECELSREAGRRWLVHLQTGMVVLDASSLQWQAVYHTNPDLKALAKRKWDILHAEGFKCRNCGETQCLTIDHIVPLAQVIKEEYAAKGIAISASDAGEKAAAERSSLDRYPFENCQTLCAWCHAEKNEQSRIHTMSRKTYWTVRRLLGELSDRYSMERREFGIISHPLTSFGVIIDEKKGLVNITKENEVWTRAWLLDNIVNNASSVSAVVYRCNKPYWIQIATMLRPVVPEEEWPGLAKGVWTATEFPHQQTNAVLITLFKGVPPALLMDERDYMAYERLPKNITVYRGLQGKRARVDGLSWTLDLNTASWFANRFGQHGQVFKAVIPKKEVFFFTNARGEQEVVLDPRELRKVVEVEPVLPVRQ
jgi:5-methylcytosine-specific restriction endonuclease McrA